jgi:hypothetical protein
VNILDKILAFNDIEKENTKIELMKDDSFAFFRGTSHLFFEHLSLIIPNDMIEDKSSLCWIQGDAHINNLGFSNKKCSSVDEVRFDINDFDESYIANPLLDIVRFGVSIGFFFDNINKSEDEELRGIDIVYQDTEIIEYFLKRYFKYITKKDYIQYDWNGSNFMKKIAKKAIKRVDTTHIKSRINKFTKLQDNKRIFDFQNPKIKPLNDSLKRKLQDKLSKEFKGDIIDICQRVTAGVGSAHLNRYYFIAKVDENELLFEVKEQLKPSFLDYFEFINIDNIPSKIHIEAKQNMIKNYDIHLQSFGFEDKDYLIKSIFNAKYSVDGAKFMIDSIDSFEKNLKEYIDYCAISLSNAHKRSAITPKAFRKYMKELKKEFYKIETFILKSYATNLLFYSHFCRDLKGK